MKSQIGCGLLEIIVKNLFSFIRSIVLSISSVFAIRPRTEQSPVKVSKIRKARMTTMRSVTSRAVEIFIVEYFLIIMAMMSVPPPEAFSKNSSAAASAGRIMAKQSSSMISSVSGCAIGNSFSKMFRRTEESTVT